MTQRFAPLVLSAITVCGAASQQVAAQADIVSRTFTTSDGVALHYLEVGTGPTIAFIPGWTMPASIWRPQLEHFRATHHVVALDPRGQGESEKASRGYHPTRRGRDVSEFLDHLGDDPAIVVGWSLGVQDVLVGASDSGTDRIRAAVLVDYALQFDPTTLASRFVALQLDRPRWTRAFVEGMYARPQSDDYIERITQDALAMPTNAAAILIANLMLVGPTDLGPALERVDRPVMYVSSSQAWARAAAEAVRTNWPDVRVEVVPQTGHALFVDDPPAFNAILEDFVGELPD